MSPEETIERFIHLGLSEQKAKETLKNANVTKFLLMAINEVRISFRLNISGSISSKNIVMFCQTVSNTLIMNYYRWTSQVYQLGQGC